MDIDKTRPITQYAPKSTIPPAVLGVKTVDQGREDIFLPSAVHDLTRYPLLERWVKVSTVKRTISPAQITDDLTKMPTLQSSRDAQRSFL